jgi:hypothetical protein
MKKARRFSPGMGEREESGFMPSKSGIHVPLYSIYFYLYTGIFCLSIKIYQFLGDYFTLTARYYAPYISDFLYRGRLRSYCCAA